MIKAKVTSDARLAPASRLGVGQDNTVETTWTFTVEATVPVHSAEYEDLVRIAEAKVGWISAEP